MIRKYKAITALSSVIAISASLALFAPMGVAIASHDSEPTMWVNGINRGQVHSYIYMVTPVSLNSEMGVSLMIKDMEQKQNLRLSVTDPLGTTTTCTFTNPEVLLVSECLFRPIPASGIYTINISATQNMGNNPVGYAIAADTALTVVPPISEEENISQSSLRDNRRF